MEWKAALQIPSQPGSLWNFEKLTHETVHHMQVWIKACPPPGAADSCNFSHRPALGAAHSLALLSGGTSLSGLLGPVAVVICEKLSRLSSIQSSALVVSNL